jgi:hypothetical protein
MKTNGWISYKPVIVWLFPLLMFISLMSRFANAQCLNAAASALAPDTAGAYLIEIEELDRIELSLGASIGNLIFGSDAQPLPLGSTLKRGMFYWQAPVGFLGKYELLFQRPDGTEMPVHVNIVPKRYSVE